MLKKADVLKVIDILDREFPDPKPPLNFRNPFELTIAVILSAQCTDERVNQITPQFFPRYNTPEKLRGLGFERFREMIHSCGYHNQKAKNIMALCDELIERHGGKVPQTLKELTALSGVGRKSAGVVLSQAFNQPASFPVDTHVFRVANRIGIVNEKTRDKTTDALEKRTPKSSWIPFHLQIIFHGRKTCKAQKPRCWECPVKDLCEFKDKNLRPT